MNSPNRDTLARVAKTLGPLAAELVFVGGRVAGGSIWQVVTLG